MDFQFPFQYQIQLKDSLSFSMKKKKKLLRCREIFFRQYSYCLKSIFPFIFFYIFCIFFSSSFRCKSFQTTKRGEFCRIPGSSVSSTAPGTPVQIRLPHVNANIFRQFILYAYTGKVIEKHMHKSYFLVMMCYD